MVIYRSPKGINPLRPCSLPIVEIIRSYYVSLDHKNLITGSKLWVIRKNHPFSLSYSFFILSNGCPIQSAAYLAFYLAKAMADTKATKNTKAMKARGDNCAKITLFYAQTSLQQRLSL